MTAFMIRYAFATLFGLKLVRSWRPPSHTWTCMGVMRPTGVLPKPGTMCRRRR